MKELSISEQLDFLRKVKKVFKLINVSEFEREYDIPTTSLQKVLIGERTLNPLLIKKITFGLNRMLADFFYK